MRVTLIHNYRAGDPSRPGSRGLLALMRAAGHRVRYRSSKHEDLESELSESADLVAVAGGDGTIAKVARLMCGRDTPIALLPTGTANNISTALGLAGLNLSEQVAGWERGRTISFDVGLARGPWGSRCFVESFGVGLIASLVAPSGNAETSAKKGPADARMVRALRSTSIALRSLRAVELEASLDGGEIGGKFVLLEAMNIGLVGPNLKLASGADPSDGRFDVVAVREEERDVLASCILAEQRGERWPHEFPSMRTAKLSIARLRGCAHIDDDVAKGPPSRSPDGGVDVAVDGRVQILLPALANGAGLPRQRDRGSRPR